MANIYVSVNKPIADGYKLKFRTPCESTTVEGLEVKYPAKNGVGTLIKKFVFKDAHGTALSGFGNLFVSGVMIEVLLDATHGVAYIQNADTNSYIESVKNDIKILEERQRQFFDLADKEMEDYKKAVEDATERAESVQGIYIGSGDMPEGYSVQIDPTSDALNMDDVLNDKSENPVKNKVITAKFAEVDGEIARVDNDIAKVDGKFEDVDEKFAAVDDKFNQFNKHLWSNHIGTDEDSLDVEGLGKYKLFAIEFQKSRNGILDRILVYASTKSWLDDDVTYQGFDLKTVQQELGERGYYEVNLNVILSAVTNFGTGEETVTIPRLIGTTIAYWNNETQAEELLKITAIIGVC